uniref:Uncharacterized protein n=1 Tax=Anguilla anguilla TaxID=7936 RepID=A0A0E9R0G3_ANGAN
MPPTDSVEWLSFDDSFALQ